jgi:hypothetical protein
MQAMQVLQIRKITQKGRAMAQAVSRRPLTSGPGFDPGSVHVGFVADKVALG